MYTIQFFANTSARRLGYGTLPCSVAGTKSQHLVWLGPLFLLVQPRGV